MAIELKKTSSFNIGVVVSNAVAAVRLVRSQETSRQESEFQKAVASGMTYADQQKFREEQLEEAETGSFPDSEYIAELETVIAQTKQMARFEKIRAKYKDSLDNYVLGKKSLESYVDVLEDTLNTEKDPAMQTELRNLLSTARQEQATNELNAIKNRALVAQRDNSVRLVEKSISEIKSRRARASIVENDDEVAMWDETLIALEGSKSKLQIEDSMNDITFKINKFNPKANDKLGYLNEEISKADGGKELVYNGVTYPSLKAFWENKRNEYIASSYFDEVKADMDAESARIAATSKFGRIPTIRIQAVNDYYNQLKAKPEFAPYVSVIEQKRIEAVSGMANELADAIYSESEYNGFDSIDQDQRSIADIRNLENRFGIAISRQPFEGETSGRVGAGATPADTTTLTNTVTTPAPGASAGGDYLVVAGDTLSSIAARNGVSLLQLLDTNPAYKANPSMVRVGAALKIPTSPSLLGKESLDTTVTPPVKPSTPAPTSTPSTPATPTQPTVTSPKKPTTAPVPTQNPTPTPTPSPKYQGTSIVDFLKTRGQQSGFNYRKTLAEQNGIMNYTGSAQQNLSLLSKLNK